MLFCFFLYENFCYCNICELDGTWYITWKEEGKKKKKKMGRVIYIDFNYKLIEKCNIALLNEKECTGIQWVLL